MTNETLKDAFPEIQTCACASLRRAARLVTQVYDAALRPAGLRATQFTMLAVLAGKGQLVQSKYADLLGMDGTTLTRNLKPLVKKDWIRIDRDDDQRVRLVSITEAGSAVMEEALPLWRAAQAKFRDGLGGRELGDMLSTLSETVDIAQAG